MSNRHEFEQGTDPRNAQSTSLRLEVSASGGITLAFLAVAEKSYTIFYTDSLAGVTWLPLMSFTPEGVTRLQQAVIAPPPASTRFYWLRTP